MGIRTALTLVSSLAFISYGIYCLVSPAMEREFVRYGLPRLRVLTGCLELLGGVGLIVGLWFPLSFWVSTGGLSLLMLCGVYTRFSIGDPIHMWFPALLLLGLNAYLFVDSLRNRT